MQIPLTLVRTLWGESRTRVTRVNEAPLDDISWHLYFFSQPSAARGSEEEKGRGRAEDSDSGSEDAEGAAADCAKGTSGKLVCDEVDEWIMKIAARSEPFKEAGKDLQPRHRQTIEEMKQATGAHVEKFPRSAEEQYEIDIKKERIYKLVKTEVLPRDTLLAYMVVSTAEERQARILAYLAGKG